MTDTTAPTPLECRFERGPLWLAILGSAVFVALGLAILTGLIEGGPTPVDRIGGKVIGALCVLFFGGTSAVALVAIFRTGEGSVVRIDEAGFFDRRIGTRPIPWSEIRGAELKRGPTLPSLGQGFVELDVIEPDRFRAGGSSWRSRLADRLNRFYGLEPLTVSAAVLDHSAEEIAAAIRSYLR